MQNYSKNAKQQQRSAKGLQRQKGRGGLQRKVTKKLKTIKERQNNCKESDTTNIAAKANNEKKWIKTQSGTKQIQRKNSYKKGD